MDIEAEMSHVHMVQKQRSFRTITISTTELLLWQECLWGPQSKIKEPR